LQLPEEAPPASEARTAAGLAAPQCALVAEPAWLRVALQLALLPRPRFRMAAFPHRLRAAHSGPAVPFCLQGRQGAEARDSFEQEQVPGQAAW